MVDRQLFCPSIDRPIAATAEDSGTESAGSVHGESNFGCNERWRWTNLLATFRRILAVLLECDLVKSPASAGPGPSHRPRCEGYRFRTSLLARCPALNDAARFRHCRRSNECANAMYRAPCCFAVSIRNAIRWALMVASSLQGLCGSWVPRNGFPVDLPSRLKTADPHRILDLATRD